MRHHFLAALALLAILPLVFRPYKSLPNPSSTPVKSVKQSPRPKNVKYPKILTFQGKLSNRGNGTLLMIDTQEAKLDLLTLARSGIGGGEWQKARGPLPSTKSKKLTHYKLKTTPLYLPNVRGVTGNFYQISPFAVSNGKVTRSDFGIHADRGNDGTLGCIGILEKDWDHFEKLMKDLREAGIKEVPLIVANY